MRPMALAMQQTDVPPALSDDEFQRFAEFFYGRTGIQFAASKRYFVDRRILERMRQCGRLGFRDYFALMKASAAEYQALVNAMTVNETYFYRESYQLDCLVNSILPAIVPTLPSKRLRIWSMPCSTGEEPYSIAFYLLERWRLVDEYEIEIVASDIDTEALTKARAGFYAPRALQHVPKATIAKYTSDAGDGERRINAALRDSIQFTSANLLDLRGDSAFSEFHVVFCRNLLIYFDDVSRREATNALYSTMARGGFICLGHSESMSRMSSLFQLVKFPEAIVYRKPV
jgi:chemotaxis protein methyltransferase CheR